MPFSVAATNAGGEEGRGQPTLAKPGAFGEHRLLANNGRSSPLTGLACLNKQESDFSSCSLSLVENCESGFLWLNNYKMPI